MATNGGLGIALMWPLSDDRMFWPVQPIEVAPLGIRAFFSKWGLEVLASELVWLWLPAVAVGALGLWLRRAPLLAVAGARLQRRDAADDSPAAGR